MATLTKSLVFLFVLLGFSGTTFGIQVKTLYEVEVPIEQESEPVDQALLLEEAFKEVLVRVSGSDKVLTNKTVVKALKKTDKYVTQFSYHEPEKDLRTIKVLFNETLVNQLLDTSKISILGKSRPSTLVWVIVEQNGIPYFAGLEPNDLSLVQKMQDTFSHRAIPVFFPMLDLNDTERVNERDIQEGTIQALEAASKRYHPEAILVGRLIEQPNDWQAHWILFDPNKKSDLEEEQTNWNNAADDLDTLLSLSADELGLKLIQDHEPVVAEKKNIHSLSLMISGIVSAKQYNKVFSYLQRLPFITSVEVVQITPQKTIFDIKANVSNEMLKKSLSSDQLLEEDPSSESTEEQLFFRVMG